MTDPQIRIKLKSFDHKLLDTAAISVANVVKKAGGNVVGPIPLPRHIQRFTVNRSPHVNKKSREQFEIRTQSRLILIDHSNSHVMEALTKLSLPAGVELSIR